MSNSELDKSYLIKKYSSSTISRFKYNFLVGVWERLFVRENNDPLFTTQHRMGKATVFNFKQRLIRLFKRNINIDIYMVNTQAIAFSIKDEVSNFDINIDIVVDVVDNDGVGSEVADVGLVV